MRLSGFPSSWFAFALGVLVLMPIAHGKDKNKKSPPKDPQDAIEVVGHIPLTKGAITGFIPTQHYSSYYLYVEHDGGKNVTLVDVTKAARPVVLADVSSPSNAGAAAGFVAVAGTAALITDQPAGTVAQPAAQTVRIMDFSDPQHPNVAREFAGVTTISRDERRGLIFLANPDGLWILHQSFAMDPEVEREYAHRVLYDR
jgi:hypothetical protein